jgi:hypothetical protein
MKLEEAERSMQFKFSYVVINILRSEFIDNRLAGHKEAELFCEKVLVNTRKKKHPKEKIFLLTSNRIYVIKPLKVRLNKHASSEANCAHIATN